jgi:hypothetical protein
MDKSHHILHIYAEYEKNMQEYAGKYAEYVGKYAAICKKKYAEQYAEYAVVIFCIFCILQYAVYAEYGQCTFFWHIILLIFNIVLHIFTN